MLGDVKPSTATTTKKRNIITSTVTNSAPTTTTLCQCKDYNKEYWNMHVAQQARGSSGTYLLRLVKPLLHSPQNVIALTSKVVGNYLLELLWWVLNLIGHAPLDVRKKRCEQPTQQWEKRGRKTPHRSRIVKIAYIYIYIYICVCVCVCVCAKSDMFS